MNIKKQPEKKTVIETKNDGGNISGKTQVNEKPSAQEKLLAGKTIAKSPGGKKQPAAARKSKETVTSTTTNPRTLQESKAELSGIAKEYIKSRNLCKVTFILPREAALKAKQVAIVGDFNNWNRTTTPLSKLENGDFRVTLELEAGKEYRFRYLIDNHRWENDWCADKYLAGPYGVEDSVVCV
jgi:hypothetical protein